MNKRLWAAFAVFILTFIFHVSAEQRDGLHVSLGAHAEAKFAPDAAPGTLPTKTFEPNSSPLMPIDDLDVHEHDEHEVIATDIEQLPAQVVQYELLAPEFHFQSVYYPLKRPPRRLA